MRKILFILLAVSLFAVKGAATVITPNMAIQMANDFITKVDGIPSYQLTLSEVMTVYSTVNPSQPVYYIYDVKRGALKHHYIIVAGENSLVDVLAYGDGFLDVDNIPEPMSDLLDFYREQMEQLLQSPGSGGNAVRGRPDGESTTGTTVGPLLTTAWGQGNPYNYHCPVTANGVRCKTGCVATAHAQIMRYWCYPDQMPAMDGYVVNSSDYGSIMVDPLPARVMDWDLMTDSYAGAHVGSDSVEAVSWLMRYVGQADRMQYGPMASGAAAGNIVKVLHSLGYNATKMSKDVYLLNNGDNDMWRDLMVAEIDAGRPIIYSAFPNQGGGGHAFNVDGYMIDDSNKKMFHINWGWNGLDYNTNYDSNGFFYLDEFMGQNTVYGRGQGMIYGIDITPGFTVNMDSVSFDSYVSGVETGQVVISSNPALAYLGDPIHVSVEGDDADQFTIDVDIVPSGQATSGIPVTVEYKPTRNGDASAVLTMWSEVADTVVTVSLIGHAEVAKPKFTVSASRLSFTEYSGYTQTQTFTVTGDQLTDGISLSLSGRPNSTRYLSVTPTWISREDAMRGATVTVTYSPLDADECSGTLILKSSGSNMKLIHLSGKAYSSQTELELDLDNDEYEYLMAFEDGQTGYVQTKTFNVTARIYYHENENDNNIYSAPIKENVNIYLDDELNGSVFSISPQTITPEQAFYGVPVTVTYAPVEDGETQSWLYFSCPNATEETYLELYGHAESRPCFRTNPASVDFDHGHTGYESTRTFLLSAYHVDGDVHLSIDGGDGLLSISPTIIPADSAKLDVPVTVTYQPVEAGETSAAIVLAASGVDTTRLALTARAISTPCVEAETNELEFNEYTGYSQTKSIEIRGYNITGDIKVNMTGNNSFSYSDGIIPEAEAQQGAPLAVTFTPSNFLATSTGTRTATISLSSPGADTTQVDLIGNYTLSEYYISTDSASYHMGHGDMEPDTLTITISCNLPDFRDGNEGYYTCMTAQEAQDDDDTSRAPLLQFTPMMKYVGIVTPSLLNAICFSVKIDGEDAGDFCLDDSTAVAISPAWTGFDLPAYYATRLPSLVESTTTYTSVTVLFNPRPTGVAGRNATLQIQPVGFTARPISVSLAGEAGLDLPAWRRGDINDDHLVDIDDVTCLIDVVLGKNVEYNPLAADCNIEGGDNDIDIDDVTKLIQYVLIGNWSQP